MGEVEKLRTQPDRAEVEIVTPGVDVHFEQTIGEGRVMRFSTTFIQGTPPKAQQQVIDHCLTMADKVKARYEMQDLEGQLAIRATALKRSNEDVAVIAKRHATRRLEIKAEVGALQNGSGELAAKMQASWVGKNRQGAWKPAGAEKRELDGIQRDIDKLTAEAAKIDETEGKEKFDAQTALTRLGQDVHTIQEEITKRRHILGIDAPASE
jgi:hypothetical protein